MGFHQTVFVIFLQNVLRAWNMKEYDIAYDMLKGYAIYLGISAPPLEMGEPPSIKRKKLQKLYEDIMAKLRDVVSLPTTNILKPRDDKEEGDNLSFEGLGFKET